MHFYEDSSTTPRRNQEAFLKSTKTLA